MPRIIHVPEAGLCERAAAEALGVAVTALRALYGGAVCAPRDYHFDGRTSVLHRGGVERAARALGVDAVVTGGRDKLPAAGDAQETPEPASSPRAFWWEDKEDD
jgi:hypothetical protein